MTRTNNAVLGNIFSRLFKIILIWGPITIGVIHQFLMFFLNEYCPEYDTPETQKQLFECSTRGDGIWVILDPPGYVYPFVTLEYQWWILLLLLSSAITLIIYFNRLPKMHNRSAMPFYIYVVYLLILVKPI